MLKKIILHEMLLNLVSLRFLLIVGLFVVLFFGGLAVNVSSYKLRLREYTEVMAVENSGAQHNLAIPPNPLNAFAEGTDQYSAMSVATSSTATNFTVKTLGKADVSLRLSAFETMDFNFVTRVILSLGAILITFASVSGERFYGTLKLASASGASRKHLILGKLSASFICLATPLLICALVSVVVLAINNMLAFQLDIVRIGLFVLFSLIYILFFVLVGIAVSIFTKRPQESLITGMLCWLVLIFILPAVVPQASKLFVDMPSAKALAEDRRLRSAIADTEYRLNYYNPDAWEKMMAKIQAGHDAGWERARNQFANYAKINRLFCLFSPSDIFSRASMEIVGNGIQNAIHAKNSILRHKDNIVREGGNPNYIHVGGTGVGGDSNPNRTAFVFNRQGFASDLVPALISMFILCLETTILLIFAYKKFMQMDLREG